VGERRAARRTVLQKGTGKRGGARDQLRVVAAPGRYDKGETYITSGHYRLLVLRDGLRE
jgi:hypothetical protein